MRQTTLRRWGWTLSRQAGSDFCWEPRAAAVTLLLIREQMPPVRAMSRTHRAPLAPTAGQPPLALLCLSSLMLLLLEQLRVTLLVPR